MPLHSTSSYQLRHPRTQAQALKHQPTDALLREDATELQATRTDCSADPDLPPTKAPLPVKWLDRPQLKGPVPFQGAVADSQKAVTYDTALLQGQIRVGNEIVLTKT